MIEVLSPSNASDTWANVALYMTKASVHEILVLNSLQIEAHLLRRTSALPWPHLLLTDSDVVTLETVGFTVPLNVFYRRARL